MAGKWLFKSDPEAYSYQDLLREGHTTWDGVTNNLALKHLNNARRGDLVMIYHSGKEKSIVGMAEVVKGPYPDPKRNDPRLVVVDLEPRGLLERPVTLEEIKKNPAFKDFVLVRISRLSVMPVEENRWKALLKLGGRGG